MPKLQKKLLAKELLFYIMANIICTPVPNYRIDVGGFAILSPKLESTREKMIEIYESLKAEIE